MRRSWRRVAFSRDAESSLCLLYCWGANELTFALRARVQERRRDAIDVVGAEQKVYFC